MEIEASKCLAIRSGAEHTLRISDTAGAVKLWEITRGIVVEDYGKVSFHLETPQYFTEEMYSTDLNIVGVAKDHKINLAEETLKCLMAHWLAKRRKSSGSQASPNGDVQTGKDMSVRNHSRTRLDVDSAGNRNFVVYSAFVISTVSPPSIITEDSHGGPWRRKTTDFRWKSVSKL